MQQPERDHKGLTKAYVALGSNRSSSAGSPADTVRAAKQAIARDSANLLAESRLFRTPAVPKGSGPDFVNAVIALETALSAEAFLARLHAVEAGLGRTRARRWGARTVDLDLLAFGDAVIPDAATFAQWRDLPPEAQQTRAPDRLIVPHPRLQDRGFVLIPMADIAPDWVHPVLGRSVSEMIAALPDTEKCEIEPLS